MVESKEQTPVELRGHVYYRRHSEDNQECYLLQDSPEDANYAVIAYHFNDQEITDLNLQTIGSIPGNIVTLSLSDTQAKVELSNPKEVILRALADKDTFPDKFGIDLTEFGIDTSQPFDYLRHLGKIEVKPENYTFTHHY